MEHDYLALGFYHTLLGMIKQTAEVWNVSFIRGLYTTQDSLIYTIMRTAN